jgi:hypothetical protein
MVYRLAIWSRKNKKKVPAQTHDRVKKWAKGQLELFSSPLECILFEKGLCRASPEEAVGVEGPQEPYLVPAIIPCRFFRLQSFRILRYS